MRALYGGEVVPEVTRRLRAARAYAGLSLDRLAEVLRENGVSGLGSGTLHTIERGERAVAPRELLEIAKACGVDESFFYGDFAWMSDVEKHWPEEQDTRLVGVKADRWVHFAMRLAREEAQRRYGRAVSAATAPSQHEHWPPMEPDIAARIHAARALAGLTLDELDARLADWRDPGQSPARPMSVRRLEFGSDRPSHKDLVDIAQVTGVPLGFFTVRDLLVLDAIAENWPANEEIDELLDLKGHGDDAYLVAEAMRMLRASLADDDERDESGRRAPADVPLPDAVTELQQRIGEVDERRQADADRLRDAVRKLERTLEAIASAMESSPELESDPVYVMSRDDDRWHWRRSCPAHPHPGEEAARKTSRPSPGVHGPLCPTCEALDQATEGESVEDDDRPRRVA